MHKIIIFGNSGSGKSTLAKQWQRHHQLAHLDLDTLAWAATDPPSRRPLAESTQAIDDFIRQHPAWVIEGCYADLLQHVSPQANQAIFMKLPMALCQANARQRPWEPHKYASQAEQDANLPMLLQWIADYEQRRDEFSEAAHQALYNDFPLTKQIITKNPT
ncbi:AAA family ATPase [Marinicella meishanensis]|uniref:AAA family ATPase n=1 Tax=Marinicella meishanensis TaxID=2873263 RepID=UPI001CBEAB37|nr:AAA family ATPase [Marinicella sp. NBU2979]